MNHGFYLRLAGTNLKNNARTYFPYWIAASLTVMMFFIIFSLSQDSGLAKMPGGTTLRSMLLLGVWVVALFAVIFLFYTNSFLIKRRKKEFGIYNILGMEKKHIARVIVLETLCTALISLSAGLAFGLLLYKLCLLLVVNLMHGQVPFGFEFSVPAVLCTAALFGGIFLLTLLSNLRQIHLSKPIELLHGGEQGEKEPKTKWILAVGGAVCLAAGYAISLLTRNALEAVTLFFLAVILVIVGTYCLFTAGSIAVLKLMRRNRNYYYQPNHFIAVSGMIYRMKQNAVGLANICILSTMVLVMISTTFSLYIGTDDLLLRRYPVQIAVTQESTGSDTLAAMETTIDAELKRQGLKTENRAAYTYLAVGGMDRGGSIAVRHDENSGYSVESLRMIYFLTLQDYTRMTGAEITLGDGEILLYNSLGTSMKSISLLGRTYTVKEQIEQFPVTGVSTANVASSY
ncbi:MAG: ABC transporter permease, partial [Firmicutes bacterium]|nr:ABC transporter permease [Bacillota bacterium]